VITLNQKWDAPLLTVRPRATSAAWAGRAHETEPASQSVRVEGPDGVSVDVQFSVARRPLPPSPAQPTPDAPYTVTVALEPGPSARYTVRPSAGPPSPDDTPPALAALGRTVTSFLIEELERLLGRRRPAGRRSAPAAPPPATLSLDREGAIQQLNAAARDALEYGPDEAPDPSFLAHVDGRNLRTVLCDLARMAQDDLQEARWLLRLETATGEWRWFRALVHNELAESGAITIVLHALDTREWERPLHAPGHTDPAAEERPS
jgi:PAS domain-containing protein